MKNGLTQMLSQLKANVMLGVEDVQDIGVRLEKSAVPATLFQRLKEYKADVALFLVLIVAGVKFTTGIDRVLDVAFYDESLYLLAGVKLAARGLYCPECGPLYAPLYNAWYFLLSFFTHDNLSLYWLNYKLVTILPALVTYVLLRKNNASLVVSAAVALVVLTCAGNVPVWPKPSHFGLIVTMLFLAWASTARSVSRTLALGSLGALLTSYVRPEYFLTSVLLAGLMVLGIGLRKEWRIRSTFVDLGAVAFVGAVIFAVLGLPVSGSRSLCAFGQHFALDWVASTGSELHPWVDWEAILVQNFGPVHGMVDVVHNNPVLFLKHVAHNIFAIAGNFDKFFPVYLFGDKLAKAALLLVLGWAFYARRDVVRLNAHRYGQYLGVVGLFLLSGLIAIGMVYPRPHYFVFPVVLIVTSLAVVLSGRVHKREFPGWTYVAILGLLIVAITPSPYLHKGDEAQENTRTIRLVQSMHINAPVNILEAEGGFNIYLGDNFQRVGENEKMTRFGKFAASRRISMVVVTKLLASDIRFKSDPEWQDFLEHYENYGFSQVQVPGSTIKVIMRKDLLPLSPKATL
jgi:hypothetical protein